MKITQGYQTDFVRERRAAGENRPEPGLSIGEAYPLAHSLAAVSILPPRSAIGHSAGETGTEAVAEVTPPNPQVSGVTPEGGPTPVSETPVTGETEAGAAPGTDAVPADTGSPQPTGPTPAAAPTLTLAPGATLTRGDRLTATITYTPPAGSTLAVTGWRYTAGSTTVTRAATDANFNSSWAGTMVISGTIDLAYRIDQGATQGTETHLTQAITVNDRSGAPWASSITENAEVSYGGQPSPPQRFPQLGVHETAGTTLPQATAQAVAGGPNQGYTFASSLQAGSYISQPKIHPDLTNAQSAFRVFHQQPGLLFLAPAAGGARVRITQPNLTFTGTPGTANFDVPQWETFYKAIHMFIIVYTQGRHHYTLVDADWALDSNARDSNFSLTPAGDGHVRTALHLSATDDLPAPTITNRGSYQIFLLLGGAAILTGTQSHEYVHAVHSHRGNYHKMMRALDPQRKAENQLYPPGTTESYAATIQTWWNEIANGMASHKLVDEAQSRTQERFVDSGADMAGVNQDPANSNALLGNVWNITGDDLMGN